MIIYFNKLTNSHKNTKMSFDEDQAFNYPLEISLDDMIVVQLSDSTETGSIGFFKKITALGEQIKSNKISLPLTRKLYYLFIDQIKKRIYCANCNKDEKIVLGKFYMMLSENGKMKTTEDFFINRYASIFQCKMISMQYQKLCQTKRLPFNICESSKVFKEIQKNLKISGISISVLDSTIEKSDTIDIQVMMSKLFIVK